MSEGAGKQGRFISNDDPRVSNFNLLVSLERATLDADVWVGCHLVLVQAV